MIVSILSSIFRRRVVVIILFNCFWEVCGLLGFHGDLYYSVPHVSDTYLRGPPFCVLNEVKSSLVPTCTVVATDSSSSCLKCSLHGTKRSVVEKEQSNTTAVWGAVRVTAPRTSSEKKQSYQKQSFNYVSTIAMSLGLSDKTDSLAMIPRLPGNCGDHSPRTVYKSPALRISVT